MPKGKPNGRVLGVPEAAAVMRVSERRVRYMLKNKLLPGKRLGHQWAILYIDAVDAYEKRLTGTHWRYTRARASAEAAEASRKRRKKAKAV